MWPSRNLEDPTNIISSYRNQTVVDPFSPKLNVVVGRNGSGKSNFFAAIRFVLGDAYTQVNREERQALLHEGHGSATMSAFVELVFANCAGRFGNQNDELILRRTIGLKKDEYSVDRKNTTKHEVVQMLETAGFSRANPYYIVPQGRITRLTNMKDNERLDLLKSVAGTQHFTTKKDESLKIMNDTNNKLAEIDDLFNQINERLGELEEEQDELRDYQDQDREKRGLEYTLFHREQDEINAALQNIENKRTGGIDDADDERERHAEGDEALAQIAQQVQALKQEMHAARLEKKQYEDDRREKAKARAQVELDVKNLAGGQDAAKKARVSRDKDLQSLKARIGEADKELKKVKPKYEADSAKEQAVKTQLDAAEAAQQRLYSKQGRNARFETKKDRDDWLQAQIDETFEALSRFKATKMQTTEGMSDDTKAIAELEKDIEGFQQTLGAGAQSFDEEIEKATEAHHGLIDDRKTMWRKEAQFDSEHAAAQDQLRKAERQLSYMMDGNTSRGLEAVRRIKQQHNLTGCYGTLAELITVNQHHTAFEVVAGNSLFHYVVDNDETATKVMEILIKERSGRVTFMPLNRLKPKTANFPQAQDARPLMSLIEYDDMYEKAVQQVFGKAIIAQNLSVAAQYARTHGLTAVTPEGDRSDKKGALTGGYHDTKQSRLKATKALIEARDRFDIIKSEGNKTRKEIERMDQRITKAVGEVQKLEQRKNQAQGSQRLLRQELRNKIELLERKQSDFEAKQKQSRVIEDKVTSLDSQQNTYQDEKKTDFKKALTRAEETELENLSTSIQKLRQDYAKLSEARAENEAKKTDLEVRLNTNLKPQLAALEADELDPETASVGNLHSRQRELARMNREYEVVQNRLLEVEQVLESKSTDITELEAQEAETKRAQDELAKNIERHQRRLEKSIQKKAALVASKQDLVESIRELGAVPDDLKTKFRKVESDQIVKRLQKVKESLKKYTSVNKHAFEHYRKSMKQREELDARRVELEKGKESIQELVEVLDQRKDEAIQRTFKQVSKAFAEVFTKLVPAGHGRLKILTKRDARNEDEESDEEPATKKKGVENYTGVAITVSFNSRHDDQQQIRQLSGGQKSEHQKLAQPSCLLTLFQVCAA